MDLQKLDWAFDYAPRSSQHGGLLVARHGYLVYEKYYGKGNREALPAMASVGKAYTSIACGIMLKEKHDQIPEGLETKVFTEKYLPEAFPLNDPRKADIKLGHLLIDGRRDARRGRQSGVREFRAVGEAGAGAAPAPATRAGPERACRRRCGAEPGEGYSYTSQSPHVASIVLRHLVGMEMQQYIDEKLAKPMGWGQWGYALHRGENTLPHTPGGADTAIRSTDVLRFSYLILHKGKWGKQQLVPAEYIEARRQAVAVPEARALQPDVRGECRRARRRRAARHLLQIGRRRIRRGRDPLARPGDL